MRAPRRFRTTVLCLALALGAAACTGKAGPSAAPAPSATASAPSPSASPSASPTPSPTETGLAALSADEINRTSSEALAKAGSLRLKGLLRIDGETVAVDMAVDSKKACTGSLAGAHMGRVELISDGSKRWFKANRVFWESVVEGAEGKETADFMADRYLTGFGDDPDMAEAFEFCDLGQLAEQTIGGSPEEIGSSPFLKKGAAGSVRGVKTYSVTVKLGTLRTEVHIADEGVPYPLRMEMTVGEESPIRLDFTDYNVPLTVKAPPARQVIDLSQYDKDGAPA